MILLNMGHPLSRDNLTALEEMLSGSIACILDVPVNVDLDAPLAPQIAALVEGVGLTRQQWQTEPILLAPPALNVIAAGVTAELHGRMGYFCPIVRLKREAGVVPPRFIIAEVVDLQALRDAARLSR